MPDIRKLRELIKPSNTNQGDGMSPLPDFELHALIRYKLSLLLSLQSL